MSDTNPVLNYEAHLSALEKIVNAMESGDLPLEEALKRYEEGIKLVRQCQQALNHAEQKINVLSRNAQGEETLSPFDADQE
ncbi:exodeoxyribonuclease VII small subunit [Suttonella sp. R2A3]|uniref:exodeoxyribonuclease VII small subunit n=1 Tax=Suttonella sp. R2A3 TaxID=2908648 RepID=UPI001F426C03|nr:exodeoxyribonuclease VII small subunit [Suttonella sp. R2A3]UJF23722.1 exodeoxyribonuclease VII small subunit [Suttonella sp. R2A3]